MNRRSGRDWTRVQSPGKVIVMSRRDFLLRAGWTAVGAAAGAAGATAYDLLDRVLAGAPSCPPLPWPCPRLDATAAAARAYEGYHEGACAYGVAVGLLGELREREGGPYTGVPPEMFRYGERGVAGRQTLCGTLNAAAAVITLTLDRDSALQVVGNLLDWYSRTALPRYAPDPGFRLLETRATPAAFEISPSIAGSPLCRDSVARWCAASGRPDQSAERAERCARLTADVVAQAVRMLNIAHGHEPA